MFISEGRLFLVPRSQISPSHSFKFAFNLNETKLEGFVVNEKGQFFGYINQCRHMGITLDWNTDDFHTGNKDALVCKTHGATYHPETGVCIGGPCLGKSLYSLPLFIESDQIFLDLGKTKELYGD